MSVLHEYLGYEFGRNALLAGTLVALLSAVVGFFVVLRRMAFVASGISHAALGGVAIGVLLHQSPVLWAIAFSIGVALMMAALAKRGVHEDTAMGVFFPASMAFGVVVVSFSKTWQSDLLSYLFGSILAVTRTDLWTLLAVTVVVVGLVASYFKELLYISFDEESAHASGIPVAPLRTLLMVLTAVTVVVSIKVVGVVLVSAMLVIPAAAAAQLSARWQWMLLFAAVMGVAAILVGLSVSFAKDVATGPAAVLAATGFFAVATAVGRLVQRRTSASTEAVLLPVPEGLAEPLPRIIEGGGL